MFTIAYDTELLRPGCVMVQRALGATIPTGDLGRLDHWLLSPTKDMVVLPVTGEQFERLIQINNVKGE